MNRNRKQLPTLVQVAALGLSLTFCSSSSLSTVSVVDSTHGKVHGFRRGGGEEAKKSKKSLRELTPRLKTG